MKSVIITGSGSGLGKALYKAISDINTFNIFGIDIKSDESKAIDLGNFDITTKDNWCDIFNYSTVKKEIDYFDIEILINCAGINNICSFEKIMEEDFDNIIDVNLKSIMFASQYCLKALRRNKGTIVNVISNASHMPMTDSFTYNASKGAAAIATRQMARELTKKYGITVFGISPNKLANTEMSNYIDKTFPPMRGMTYEEGRKYQLNGLLTGKETDPKQIAELLVFLLSKKERHEYLSGCILELGL